MSCRPSLFRKDKLHGLLIAEIEHERPLQIGCQRRIVLVDDHEDLGILDAIEQIDYDVFNHRAYVGKVSKLLDLPRSFVLAQAR